VLVKKPGDAVKTGDVLLHVHAQTDAKTQTALTELQAAITIGSEPPHLLPLWLDVVTA
jgi:thymidine phosphorylase